MQDRRRQSVASDTYEYLHQLPALSLLDRLPTPMIGVGTEGNIAYANPACAELLGYVDGRTLTRLYLPELLDGHALREPPDCISTLRSADGPVGWNHAEGHLVRTAVSAPLLVRSSDELLLVGLNDVTSWLWEHR